MNNDIIDLQIRLAHQENHIQELDKIIYSQQRQIDGLQKKLLMLEKSMKLITEPNILGSAEDKPPPHY